MQRQHSRYRPSITIEESKLVTTAHEARLNVTHFEIIKRQHVLLVFLLHRKTSLTV